MNPGMAAVELDITDPAHIERVAAKLIADFPDLNVLFNNAGVMLPDQAGGKVDETVMMSHITTNLMGPIRMTSALIDHLKTKEDAAIAYTSFGAGFRAVGCDCRVFGNQGGNSLVRALSTVHAARRVGSRA